MTISPLDLLNLVYVSLRGKLLRSALSSLGVFMGVVAVSAPLQVNNIGRAIIAREMTQREVPQVKIYPAFDPITNQFANTLQAFGFGATPLLEDDRLIINLGGQKKSSGVIAVSKRTGETLWSCSEEISSYCTPIATTIDGRRLVFVSAAARCWSPRCARRIATSTPTAG